MPQYAVVPGRGSQLRDTRSAYGAFRFGSPPPLMAPHAAPCGACSVEGLPCGGEYTCVGSRRVASVEAYSRRLQHMSTSRVGPFRRSPSLNVRAPGCGSIPCRSLLDKVAKRVRFEGVAFPLVAGFQLGAPGCRPVPCRSLLGKVGLVHGTNAKDMVFT